MGESEIVLLYTFNTLLFGVFGLVVGSFVNVAVYRTGFRERTRARSHCMACQHQLGALDLIPVLSYVYLRGRCRHCESRISPQYPLVELGVATLFASTYWLLMPLSYIELLVAVAFAAAWAALMAISVYDLRHTLVPGEFVAALSLAALVRVGADAYGLMSTAPIIDAALGALALGGFFALISLVSRGRGMGIGDALVAAPIGALLGLSQGILAALVATWVGAALGIALVCARALRGKGVATLKTEVPFAPFLFVGALCTFWLGVGVDALVGSFTILTSHSL